MNRPTLFWLIFLSFFFAQPAFAQGGFWARSSEFSPARFWPMAGGGAIIYGASLAGLNNVWYKQYPRSNFHFFDDHKEWLQMDKAGHIMTAYTEANWSYNAFRWAGVKEGTSIWLGAGTGFLLQSGIEVLDGFSAEWGFSWSDIAANTIGAALFAAQQSRYGEQRIILKVSNTPIRYAVTPPVVSTDGTSTTTLQERASELFGNEYSQTFFKDYNAAKFWITISPDAYLPAGSQYKPGWLSLSMGYGAGNLYGGFTNKWVAKNGAVYELGQKETPRFRMVLFSLDVDFARIPTKDPFFRGVFHTINFIKVPAPTLEISGTGKVKFRWLYF